MISIKNALLAASSVICSTLMIIVLQSYTPKTVVAEQTVQPVTVVKTYNYETMCQERTVEAVRILKEVYHLDDAKSNTIAPMASYASVIEGVPIEVLLSVIKIESSFDEKATDGVSVGYMQIKPSAWKNEIPYNVKNPQGNILAGAFVLKRYYLKTGNWSDAVRAYNIGITDFSNGRRKGVANAYHNKVYSEMKLILAKR